MTSADVYRDAERAVTARVIAILTRLESDDLATAELNDPRGERRWRYRYAADRLRHAKALIEAGESE